VPFLLSSWRCVLAAFGIALCLPGCAAFRSYDAELYVTLERASSGNVDGAIELLEANNRLPDKDLLYYLELGMLQRLGNRYEESQKSWMAANARVQSSKAGGLVEVLNFMRGVSSFMVNDKLRAYHGHDYEKVMLLTYMALNHLAMGDHEGARVAVKQTHELEAEIAELRSRQLAEVEEEARKRGARTSFKELNGYPVETIDNPTVNALKNSYQSALSHYLAGFIYESLGELSLAAPGYRMANELQPNQPLLEEALRGVDQRVGAPDDGMTDVLFVIGSGSAPALQSRQFLLPVAIESKVILIAGSFPVMTASSAASLPTQLTLDDGRTLAVAPMTSIDLMARRRLKDDMAGIMLRAAIRSTASAVLQYQAQRGGDKEHAAMALAAAVMMAGSAVLESADYRTWRALPSEVSIARGRLPRGTQTITLHTPEGPRSARFSLAGRYAVVDFRLLRHQVFVSAPKVRGQR
jgi:hypothetical protein